MYLFEMVSKKQVILINGYKYCEIMSFEDFWLVSETCQ